MGDALKTESYSAAPAVESEFAIELQDVRVAYRSYKEAPSTIKEALLRLVLRGQLRHYSTFDAVQDVSFTVRKGKVYGIIGSNGSGKSTLLKVIAGVLEPAAGTVEVHGTVASLIELGAGFDPELNAVENIFLHSSLYGFSRKDIEPRVERILEFAELSEFSSTPIKYYSSGMFARLGFSVAMDIDPDILLVDEVLGVGDERFQQKCKKVFDDFISRGKTIIIVTHAMDQFEGLVDHALLLSCGKLIFDGAPGRALEIYRETSYETALQ